MADGVPIQKYARVGEDERVFQGEIFVGLIQVRQNLETIGKPEGRTLDEIVHPFCIVVTQDCDLESDFRLRSKSSVGAATLPNILFCHVIETVVLKELGRQQNRSKTLWDQITQNKNERYQCIERIPSDLDDAGHGLPSLASDFKYYFSVPTDEVYKRITLRQMQRRCRLTTPYAEHFLSRFCAFQSRFPLPEDHFVE